MPKYRLYIDESGTHNYSQSDQIDKKYLGLTGIFIDSEEYEKNLVPKLTEIKRLFSDDLDDLPVLHREDIVAKRGIFNLLNDPSVESRFNDLFFELLNDTDYTICCVVLDKKSHLARYQSSAYYPYHYCLNVLLERYVHFLQNRGIGDVMAEARGKKEDTELSKEYQAFYLNGTSYRKPTVIQAVLTSRNIKIKGKISNIYGLEFADLLSLPTKLDVLFTFNALSNLSVNFTKKIIDKIQPKYCRSYYGRMKGYGKKIIV